MSSFVSQLGSPVVGSLQEVWSNVIMFLPKLIIAVIVFIIGWIIAGLVKHAIVKVCEAIKLDRLFESAGAGEVMERAGLKFSAGGFLGTIVKWFIMAAFLLAVFDILALVEVADFLKAVVGTYLPKVFIASLILVVATIVADIVYKLISGTAKATKVKSANMLATISKYAIWIFALIVAFAELGVAQSFMQILFTGIIAMLAIAGGLAFGLGAKDQAGRFIDKLKNDIAHDNM